MSLRHSGAAKPALAIFTALTDYSGYRKGDEFTDLFER
jgi:hypothetical protein